MNTYLFEELPRADRNRIETITNKVMECHDDPEDMEYLKDQTIKTDKTMKTTHTPGDWYDKPTGSAQHVVASEQTGETIAVVYNDNQANARLISAAPELLEALNGLLMCPDLNLDSLEAETVEAIQHARQAIHKSTNGNG